MPLQACWAVAFCGQNRCISWPNTVQYVFLHVWCWMTLAYFGTPILQQHALEHPQGLLLSATFPVFGSSSHDTATSFWTWRVKYTTGLFKFVAKQFKSSRPSRVLGVHLILMCDEIRGPSCSSCSCFIQPLLEIFGLSTVLWSSRQKKLWARELQFPCQILWATCRNIELLMELRKEIRASFSEALYKSIQLRNHLRFRRIRRQRCCSLWSWNLDPTLGMMSTPSSTRSLQDLPSWHSTSFPPWTLRPFGEHQPSNAHSSPHVGGVPTWLRQQNRRKPHLAKLIFN